MQVSMDILPIEIIRYIFSSLPPADIARCRRVCREWDEVANENKLWMRLLHKNLFGVSKLVSLSSTPPEDESSWMKIYSSFRNLSVSPGIAVLLQVIGTGPNAPPPAGILAPQVIGDLISSISKAHHVPVELSERQPIRFRVFLINLSDKQKQVPSRIRLCHYTNDPLLKTTNSCIFASGEAFRQVVKKNETKLLLRQGDWVTSNGTLGNWYEYTEVEAPILPGEVKSFDCVAYYTSRCETAKVKVKATGKLMEFQSKAGTLTFTHDGFIGRQFRADKPLKSAASASPAKGKPAQTLSQSLARDSSPSRQAEVRRFKLCINYEGATSNYITFVENRPRPAAVAPPAPASPPKVAASSSASAKRPAQMSPRTPPNNRSASRVPLSPIRFSTPQK